MAIIIPGAVGSGIDYAGETIGRGILTHATIFTNTIATDPGATLVHLYLANSELDSEDLITHIVSGYIDHWNPLSWNGSIEINDPVWLVLRRSGNQLAEIQATIKKLQPSFAGATTEYLSNAVRT